MLESLITQYGYPILFIGTFLEGETVLVLGGVAAHLGYLSLDGVIACGFSGTLFGDQLYFFLGRRHGQSLLQRRPTWQKRAERVFRIMERHQNWLIIGFRFIYGLRTITPFAIGTSKVAYWRFSLLNTIGAGVWATSIGVAGYYFGEAVHAMVGNIKRYELMLMAGIAAIGILIWLLHRFLRRRSDN